MKNYFFLLILLLSVQACVPYKDLVLFRKTETPLPEISSTILSKNTELLIQPNDALSITVNCLDPTIAEPFNLVDRKNGGQINAESPLANFLVDNNGDITYPVLGKIAAAKKTIAQLRDTLTLRLRPYIKDPSVNIRRVNFHITVIGEVTKAGIYTINSERITLLEAIGMAGDFTPYSDRQRVLVVREEGGKVTTAKIDLQTPDFFTSPYYFLHQNDVVYIDPKASKKGAVNDRADKYINRGAVGLSALSVVLTILLLFK